MNIMTTSACQEPAFYLPLPECIKALPKDFSLGLDREWPYITTTNGSVFYLLPAWARISNLSTLTTGDNGKVFVAQAYSLHLSTIDENGTLAHYKSFPGWNDNLLPMSDDMVDQYMRHVGLNVSTGIDHDPFLEGDHHNVLSESANDDLQEWVLANAGRLKVDAFGLYDAICTKAVELTHSTAHRLGIPDNDIQPVAEISVQFHGDLMNNLSMRSTVPIR